MLFFLFPECGFLSRSCLEELLDEKGIKVDHATPNRKVVRYPSSVYDGRGQHVGLAPYNHGRCKARYNGTSIATVHTGINCFQEKNGSSSKLFTTFSNVTKHF